MKVFLTVLKWILIIAFFPASLLVVAYYRNREAKKQLYKRLKKEDL